MPSASPFLCGERQYRPSFPFSFSTPPTSYLPPGSAVKGEGYVCATCRESSCQHAGRPGEVPRAGSAHSSAVYLFVPSVCP